MSARATAWAWLPVATGLTGLAAALVLWQSLRSQEERQLVVLAESEVRSTAGVIQRAVQATTDVFARVGDRHGVALRDRDDWSIDLTGVKASLWVDPSGKVRVLKPLAGNESLAAPGLWANAAFIQTPPGRPSISRSLIQPEGDSRFDFAVPIRQGDQVAGYLVGVFSVRDLCAVVLSVGAAPGWAVAVFEDEREVFRRGSPVDGRWIAEASLGTVDHDRRLRVGAGPEILARVRSMLPSVVLLTGCLIAVLLACSVGLAQSARRRAREAEAAHAALSMSEQQLRAILDATMARVYVKDAQGRFLLVNRQTESFFGRPMAEILGRTDHELTQPEVADDYRANDRKVLEAGAPLQIEETAPLEDGLHTYISVKVPLVDGSGRPYAVCGISTDITERTRYEEMQRRSEALERQHRLAREASRLKSEFLASMSHELRTPLNAIMGFAELLHDGRVGPLLPEQTEFLGDILTSSRHLAQLVNDVLDLSKVEAGRMEFRPEPVDPAAIVTETRDVLRSLAASKGIRVGMEIAPGLGEVVVDPGKLRQVLYNYLSNALKFTPEGGAVTIHAAPEGADAFRLEVADSGIGIRPEEIGLLFTEFQQLGSGAARQHVGTGLGLALTKRIVEAQGGHVGARSRPGAGSLFFVVLPRFSPALREAGPPGSGGPST